MTTAFQRAGSGEPLVFVHGGLADHRVWGAQVAHFSKRYEVLAWDAPGAGASPDPPPDFGMEGYADALGELIQTLGAAPAHVVGHSFGGGVAIALYARHPQTVRSLVLAGAYAGWKGSLPDDEVRSRRDGVLAALDSDPASLVESFAATLFSRSPPPEVVALSRSIISDLHPAGARAMALAFAGADLRWVLPTISVPTLIVHGEHDQRAPREVADALHRMIPRSRMAVIAGAGHESYLEAPERFNAEVERFLSGVNAG